MLIDTHAHLYWNSYKDDLQETIQRSIANGVTTIINVGVDIELSKKALEQTTGVLANVPGFKAYSTLGIHPHEAVNYSDGVSIHQDINELEKIYQSRPDQIVAIGECGLDFFFKNNHLATSLSPDKQKTLQKQLFQAQIELAQKINLPLIVHCRDDRLENPQNSEAWDEALKMIGDHPAILHCYSGLSPITDQILKSSNLIASFAATITYPKNDYLRDAAKILPLDKIVLETDCPFLPPQSKRGERNEPANIKELAQLIADLKGTSLSEVENQTTTNAVNIFNLPV